MLTGRNQAFLLLASCALAASAHASYAQMRLDGVGLILAFLLTVAYGLIVDLALFARIFRYRAALIVGSIVALVVVLLFLSQAASPSERTGFFKGAPGGPGLVVLVATSAVFLPFIVIAPFAQHLSMRHGRRWPGWIAAWMALQLALLPAFLTLGFTEKYYRQQEYMAGHAEGSRARAGELAALLDRADQNFERIWGTGWTYPWRQSPPAASPARPSGWIFGLASGMNDGALIAANEPLRAPDRVALRTLMDRHLSRYAVPDIRAKLLWDTLEPGGFSAKLVPELVSEEAIPVLLERLEKYGEARFCPGGRMIDADRAALDALLLAKGQPHEMRPPWSDYRRRAERLCVR